MACIYAGTVLEKLQRILDLKNTVKMAETNTIQNGERFYVGRENSFIRITCRNQHPYLAGNLYYFSRNGESKALMLIADEDIETVEKDRIIVKDYVHLNGRKNRS